MAVPILVNKSALLAIGIVLAIIGVRPEIACARISPNILTNIPYDCQYVSVIDVQKLVRNPLFGGPQHSQTFIAQIAADLESFAKETGVDPARNISYLLLARSRSLGVRDDLMIAIGKFDKKKILHYMESKNHNVKQQYRGADVISVLDQKGIPGMLITFLGDQGIAFGPDYFVREVLDTKAGRKQNILSDPRMKSFMNSAPANDMLWFVGKSEAVLSICPVPIPYQPLYRIQSITGGFNIAESFTGKVSITAVDSDAATKLANYYKKIAAVAQLLEDPNAGLKLLADGMTVKQNESHVDLSLNFQADNLSKLWSWSTLRAENSSSPMKPQTYGKNIDSLPEIMFNPAPSYTEEARRKKVEGEVFLQFVIRKDGTVDSFKIVKGLGYGLDESAIQTIAAKWRFIPGLVNGIPIDVIADSEIAFRLY